MDYSRIDYISEEISQRFAAMNKIPREIQEGDFAYLLELTNNYLNLVSELPIDEMEKYKTKIIEIFDKYGVLIEKLRNDQSDIIDNLLKINKMIQAEKAYSV